MPSAGQKPLASRSSSIALSNASLSAFAALACVVPARWRRAVALRGRFHQPAGILMLDGFRDLVVQVAIGALRMLFHAGLLRR
jgi:hypothetical protein